MAIEQKTKSSGEGHVQGFVYLPLLAGWLVPGAGHFLLGKWYRGALIAVSILGMFMLGVAMQGKLFTEAHDILGILGLIGDLGNGLVYVVARMLGVGTQMVSVTTADYGKIFIVGAGLLNVISAVDAHRMRTGRKPL